MTTEDEIRKIGFNDSVDYGTRNLHVQTEVMLRGGILIRTMVLEGGIVKLVDRHTCPPELELEQIRACARSRHEQHLEAVRRGMVE